MSFESVALNGKRRHISKALESGGRCLLNGMNDAGLSYLPELNYVGFAGKIGRHLTLLPQFPAIC